MDPSVFVTLLPDDVIALVLSRLPLRSLVASRHVCKAWRAIVDEQQLLLRHLLPHAVSGIFINYIDHDRPHFFARPTSTPGHRINGKFRFVDREEPWQWYRVQDHCNGLVLRSADHINGDSMYVINPATRRWAHLPPCGKYDRLRRAFIVFDPAVSPHYEVLLVPEEEGMQPAAWTWHVLSSTTKTWEERVFVRDGTAPPDELPQPKKYFKYDTQWRFAAYWQGALYVHCRGEFVSRLSLSNDTYTVIKSPIEVAECNAGVGSFIGKSRDGIYFAAIDDMKAHLRVWVLIESADKRTTEWLLKHQSALNPRAWWTSSRKKGDKQCPGPWVMEICDDSNINIDAYDGGKYEEDWDSDDDHVLDIPNNDDGEDGYVDYVKFLGFHPYKDVIFLYRSGIAVAFHLSNAKVQHLGHIYPRTYNGGFFESFVYTPCLIRD